MTFHIDADIISLCFLLVMTVAICRNFISGSRKEMCFVACAVSGLVTTAIDIAARTSVYLGANYEAVYIFTTLYYMVIMIPVLCWLMYVFAVIYADPEDERKARYVLYGVYLLYYLFVLGNILRGYMFKVTPDGQFIEGQFWESPLLLYALFSLSGLLFVILKWDKIQPPSMRWTLIVLPFIVALGIIIQLCLPGYVAIMPAYSIMLLVAYTLIQNDQFQTVKARNRLTVERLRTAANTDGMTGVYNRAAAEGIIKATLSEGDGSRCMLIIADMDDLKGINDSYGHFQGDRFLISIARAMSSHFRRTDLVGRLGGDEFCAFIRNISNETVMRQSLSALSRKLVITVDVDGEKITRHCSIGSAFGVSGQTDFATLYRQADAALYHIKRSGKNGYAVYHPGIDSEEHVEQNTEPR